MAYVDFTNARKLDLYIALINNFTERNYNNGRTVYTKYKTAPNEEEREKARQEYLEKVGMHRNFRW